jgi:hypothetical protein
MTFDKVDTMIINLEEVIMTEANSWDDYHFLGW